MSAGQVAERGGWGPFASPKALSHLCIGGTLACCEVERASRPSSSWFPLLGIPGAFFVLGAQVELHRCVSGAAPEQCCSVWALASVLPCQSPGESGHCGRETWPAHPPVPFSAPGVRLSSRQRSSTVGPRNVCGHLEVSGACLRELASFVPAPGERTAPKESQGDLDRSGE